MTFAVLLIGGHTTTTGAGMAFPDWPLSRGSINPDGWWHNVMERLEHGHRYFAEGVALLIGLSVGSVTNIPWRFVGGLVLHGVVMMLVCMLACIVPTRRVLAIQPTEALRGDG